jgi:ABC-type transport system involved in multi-copper enzyme maturation permease subunit
MMWLTWRQFRPQAIAAAAVLAVLAVVLLISGLGMAHLYASSGLGACHAHHDCESLASSFLRQLRSAPYGLLHSLGGAIVLLAPAVIGMFWGAPLISREIETGTFRLAWNQSVSRDHWILVKLGLIGLASMVAAALASLMVTWWAAPITGAEMLAGPSSPDSVTRFTPIAFGAGGVVPVGYAAFAFAFGVTAGLLVRRTVPAMAVTLAAFALVQIAWPLWIRSHLIAPVHAVLALGRISIGMLAQGPGNALLLHAGSTAGQWILSSHPVNAAGHAVRQVPQACLGAFSGGPAAFPACLARNGIKVAVTYQPDSRYWTFQWYETAIFLVLAAVLAGFCYWRISRRALA